jgi:hypothetical protein
VNELLHLFLLAPHRHRTLSKGVPWQEAMANSNHVECHAQKVQQSRGSSRIDLTSFLNDEPGHGSVVGSRIPIFKKTGAKIRARRP